LASSLSFGPGTPSRLASAETVIEGREPLFEQRDVVRIGRLKLSGGWVIKMGRFPIVDALEECC